MQILFVDDHPLVLEGLASALRRCQHQVVTADSVAQGMEFLTKGGPFDLLLFDYHMPGSRGTDLLTAGNLLPPRMVVISGMMEEEGILHLLETTSVNAFISKMISLDGLCKAVEQLEPLPVVRGVWDEEQQRFVPGRELFKDTELVTPREREVYMLMRTGLQDKEIADRLGRSIHTIRVQIRAIKRKKGQRRRAMQDYGG